MMASFLRTDIRDDVYTAVSNVVWGDGPVLMKTFQELASLFVDPAIAAKDMPRADLDFRIVGPNSDRDHAIGAASIAEGPRMQYDAALPA